MINLPPQHLKTFIGRICLAAICWEGIRGFANAEINEKQARSIKYQLTIAKLPLAKDLSNFEDTTINQTLVNDLAGGGFVA